MRITRRIAKQETYKSMAPWDNELHLLTPEEFDQLPDGTELHSIMEKNPSKIKGTDKFSMDTRWGHLAYGIKDPWNHPLKDLFLIFKLKQ